VKKIVHTLFFWRYRVKKGEENQEEEEDEFLSNQLDNNIEQVKADKEYLESKGVWVRGSSRISNEVLQQKILIYF
jgi:hypothetical protein